MTIKRFHIKGDKSGSKNGYEIHATTGAIIRGSWKDNKKEIIQEGIRPSRFDRAQYKRSNFVNQYDVLQRQERLREFIQNGTAITKEHPYLNKKGLSGIEIMISKDETFYPGSIVVPMMNIYNGKWQSAQFIDNDGAKKFAGGLPAKCGYNLIPAEQFITPTVYICEGYATALTIRLLTECSVYCCFSASNLIFICKAFKELGLMQKYNIEKVIIAADHDKAGLDAAKQAQNISSFDVVYPPPTDFDFNDAYQEDSESIRNVLLNLKEEGIC